MQLAYALTYAGKPAATYEAAMVRAFDLGRTETVRVCTEASSAFVQNMLDPRAGNSEQRHKLGAALKQHGLDMREAGSGKGADRHLFGAKQVSPRQNQRKLTSHLAGLKRRLQSGEEIPAFFQDELLQRSGHWTLSTSQVIGERFDAYGWGAVVPDGHGMPPLSTCGSTVIAHYIRSISMIRPSLSH